MNMIKYIGKSPLLIAFGNRIKTLRMGKGWNQITFAANCNMEKSTMSKIESGQVNLSFLTLNRIIQSLEMTFIEFFAY
jgi:transcriptional regulator with XRE-family HTH domain